MIQQALVLLLLVLNTHIIVFSPFIKKFGPNNITRKNVTHQQNQVCVHYQSEFTIASCSEEQQASSVGVILDLRLLYFQSTFHKRLWIELFGINNPQHPHIVFSNKLMGLDMHRSKVLLHVSFPERYVLKMLIAFLL